MNPSGKVIVVTGAGSGMGRELGEEGLDAFRETKHVHLDFVPERKAFWFPYRNRRSEIPS